MMEESVRQINLENGATLIVHRDRVQSLIQTSGGNLNLSLIGEGDQYYPLHPSERAESIKKWMNR